MELELNAKERFSRIVEIIAEGAIALLKETSSLSAIALGRLGKMFHRVEKGNLTAAQRISVSSSETEVDNMPASYYLPECQQHIKTKYVSYALTPEIAAKEAVPRKASSLSHPKAKAKSKT